ncbi:unnamed protein product [Cuscuta campestris]|uniref:Uncharacterized protein n=1 Tax=Cuscuta campestris TaxID=132261 RepID=A0A484M9G5_9ASTE|nr:unnamed protein product [Cuscuta campestris]
MLRIIVCYRESNSCITSLCLSLPANINALHIDFYSHSPIMGLKLFTWNTQCLAIIPLLCFLNLGGGVGSVFSAAMKGASVYEVDYCRFTILKREIGFGQEHPFTAGELTNHSDSGIKFLATRAG